jgi:hypothetical protein
MEGLQPLLSSGLRVQVAFACANFGALLGWLQIRAEKHPDLWAFLVHRPISRTKILMSKVAAGLLLYVVAGGLPIFVFAVVTSIPGKVAAPFEWAMALPLAAVFLSGVVYYFAGLLTGLRKARWFASRGFGLGMAGLASACVLVPEFWQALALVAGVAALLFLAVWGSIRTGGHYRTQPVPAKLALVLACTVSSAIVIWVVFGVLIKLLFGDWGFSYVEYQLLKDGRVAKISHHVLGRDLDEDEVVDLNGKPFVDGSTGRILKLKELQGRFASGLTSMTVDFDNRAGSHYKPREGYTDMGRFFAPWRVLDKTIWYLTADGRAVAYHLGSRRRGAAAESWCSVCVRG